MKNTNKTKVKIFFDANGNSDNLDEQMNIWKKGKYFIIDKISDFSYLGATNRSVFYREKNRKNEKNRN